MFEMNPQVFEATVWCCFATFRSETVLKRWYKCPRYKTRQHMQRQYSVVNESEMLSFL